MRRAWVNCQCTGDVLTLANVSKILAITGASPGMRKLPRKLRKASMN